MENSLNRKYRTDAFTRRYDREFIMAQKISRAYWAGKAGENLIKRVYCSISDPQGFLRNALETRFQRNKKASKLIALESDLVGIGVFLKSFRIPTKGFEYVPKNLPKDLTKIFDRKIL